MFICLFFCSSNIIQIPGFYLEIPFWLVPCSPDASETTLILNLYLVKQTSKRMLLNGNTTVIAHELMSKKTSIKRSFSIYKIKKNR